MSATANILHEAIVIDVDTLETGAVHLICLIKPTWTSKKINFKKLDTNDDNNIYSVFPSDYKYEQHGIIMKIYPKNSDVYSNHEKEFQLIEQFSHHGVAPRILLTFINGYISSYILGTILNIKEDQTHQLVSQKLAEFHLISSKFNNGLHFIDKLKQFIDLFTKKNINLHNRLMEIRDEQEKSAEQNSSFFTTLKSAVGLNTTPTLILTLDELELQLHDTTWAQISTEIDFIQTIFENNWSKHNLPNVLCLNNMNIHNFLYDSKNKTISIINFDHCSYNYFLIDIVSYFLELAKDNYENNYPQRHIQKLFLVEYLKYSSFDFSNIVYDPHKPIDNELERLCDLCGLLIAPIHLYWTLWAFLQALLIKPTSTFDYINYGKIRLAQYQKHKQNFFLPLNQSRKNSDADSEKIHHF
ncbi:unnamed protein product [Rotaria sordida]|uniref:ethanolamine kinase n=1 Tax=Rotaria sordida TaxID=392033 RepID=A0A815J7D0_9BILA|nr:unnamed protein product [Rotaria sordida]CAF1406994.1 unnamed protein product [Rotaria sordida]CAF3853238.1 unnamed protein product [Rotaria sordida]CAF4017989.1 unnamed protein product [Rotaria sordida]